VFSKRGFVTLLLVSVAAQGQTRDRPFFQASRALAMGDAFTAYGEGFEAVYYNPAGVARKNKLNVKYLDVEGVVSAAMLSAMKDYVSSLGRLSGVVDLAVANADKPFALGLGIFPQVLIKNFSIGFLARTYTEATVRSSDSNLESFSFADAAVYAHVGTALFGGVLKLGVGAKALNRAELNRTYTPAAYNAGLSLGSQWKEGIAFGFDAGLLLTAPIALLPALGISVLDIGNTKFLERRILFTGSNGTPGTPPAIKQRVNAGFALNPKHGRGIRSVISVEIKDILNTTKNYTQRIHAGYELGIRDIVFLRAGWNEGRYWTAGLGIKIIGVGLEFATYGENVAFTGNARRDDRKYVGRYYLNF